MGLDGSDLTPPAVEDDELDDAPAAPPAASAPPPSIALTPDLVKSSPEYRALQEQNRTLARQKGDAERAAADARTAAETARLAAQAASDEAVRREIEGVLGTDGVAVWQQFSELSSSDPVAAARLLAEFRGSGAPPAAPAPVETEPAIEQEGTPAVPAQGLGAPPPPPIESSLHASNPLGSVPPQDSDEALENALGRRFDELANRAQHPLSQRPLTERERNEGIMAHFAKGVVNQLRTRRAGS